jgi:hypothetical protein
MLSNSFENESVFTQEQVLENRGRVAIFIDGSNLFYAALQLGSRLTTPSCFAA